MNAPVRRSRGLPVFLARYCPEPEVLLEILGKERRLKHVADGDRLCLAGDEARGLPVRTPHTREPHRLDRSGNARVRLPPSIEATKRSRRSVDRADGIALAARSPSSASLTSQAAYSERFKPRGDGSKCPPARLSSRSAHGPPFEGKRGCSGSEARSTQRLSRRNRRRILIHLRLPKSNSVYRY